MIFKNKKNNKKGGQDVAQNIEDFTTFQMILHFLEPFKKPITISFVLLTLVEIVRIAIPFSLGKVTEIVSDGGLVVDIIPWIVAGYIAFTVVSFLDMSRDRLELNRIDWILPHTIFLKISRRLIDLSIGQMQSSHSGFKQSVINRGMSSVRNIVMTIMYQGLPIIMQITVATIVTVVVAPEIGWILIGALVVIIIVMVSMNPHLTKEFPKLIKFSNTNNKRIADFLKNMGLIKVTTQIQPVIDHVDQIYVKHHNKGREIFIVW